MADKPASERTEQATPERLKKAREEGRIPQSMEVPSALVIALLLVTLVVMAGSLYRWFVLQVHDGLSLRLAGVVDPATFDGVMRTSGLQCLSVLAPFMAVAAAASVLGSTLAGGWTFAPKALRLQLSRLSPANGLKSLLSLRSVVQLVVSIAKLAVILSIAWHYLKAHMETIISLQWATPAATLCAVARLILGLLGRIAAALIAIACADLLYQRWNHKRQLRMSRQEVKEEHKQHEASPEVKARVRSAQMAMARKRMLQDVPNADVVVTNPSHYAVALRYDPAAMDAPQVVAKGADFLCEKIKEVARAHGVPIIERPELARALYAAVQPGQTVPEALFVAVAEILAMIYRLRGRRRNPWKGGGGR